jgi:hypothetical protein
MLCYTMPNQISFYQTVFHINMLHNIIPHHVMSYIIISTPQTHKHTHTHPPPPHTHTHTHTYTPSLTHEHTLYLESVPHVESEVRILANHDPTHLAIVTPFLFSVLLQSLITEMQFHHLLQRQKGRERR